MTFKGSRPLWAKMEVLLEVNQGRKEVLIDLETAASVLKSHLPSNEACLLPFDKSDDRKPVYVLQKWSEKWKEYIDVSSVEEVKSGDRLAVYLRKEQATAKAQQQCKGLMEPSKAHKEQLAKLFPSTSSGVPRATSRAFDPGAKSVVALQQSKKKKGITRDRPRKITAVLLPQVLSTVPKSSARKRLSRSGRIQKIELRHRMSHVQAKNELLKAFSLFQVSHFTFLSCGQSNDIVTVDNQTPNGEEIIQIAGQGSLYLYEGKTEKCKDLVKGVTTHDSSGVAVAIGESSSRATLPVTSGAESTVVNTTSSSGVAIAIGENANANVGTSSKRVSATTQQPDSATITKRANEAMQELQETRAHEPIYISNDEDDMETVSEADDVFLREWRRVRTEQDESYQHGLKVDIAKADKEMKTQKLTELKRILQKHYTSPVSKSLQLAFKLPNGERVVGTFAESAPLKDLYGYVFACGNVEGPFGLVLAYPRKEIPLSTQTMDDFGLLNEEVIAVEMSAVEFDPLIIFSSQLPQANTNKDFVDSNEEQQLYLEQELKHRVGFCQDSNFVTGRHLIRRAHLFEDMEKVYRKEEVVRQYPFRVKFEGEKGIDAGGLARDALSGFWHKAYCLYFDGPSLVVPVLHPTVDMARLSLLGRVLSHGYLACGVLPVRIPFPSLCAILLGPQVKILDDVLVDSFMNYLPDVEGAVIEKILHNRAMSSTLKNAAIAIFSRFGCLEVPTVSNILRLCAQVAKHEFAVKPMGVLCAISSGIPSPHKQFWSAFTVETLLKLYLSLTANPSKVLQQINEPFFADRSQEKVFNYLVMFVGNMKCTEVQLFLRFVTGSSVCPSRKIEIAFNKEDNAARRPVAHTCSFSLHLSSQYTTYTEFAGEFTNVLSKPEYWRMDAI